jgi:Lrp/AsnC family leucine-responsive transcriptional regulator
MIDDVDRKILATLQEDARTSNADLARQLGMAPSAVLERVRKLEARGVVRAYEARLDPSALGLGLLAFIFVRSEEKPGANQSAVASALADIPEVQEVHHVAGEDCYLLKVRTENAEALGQLLRRRIGAVPEVTSTRSTIVFDSLKETARLRLPEPRREDEP